MTIQSHPESNDLQPASWETPQLKSRKRGTRLPRQQDKGHSIRISIRLWERTTDPAVFSALAHMSPSERSAVIRFATYVAAHALR